MELNKISLLIILITINIINILQVTLAYELPELTFLLLSPKGFRVSIPDEPGIKLFAFHGAINRNTVQPEPGNFYDAVTAPRNQQWIYENVYIEIRPNDIIHYWYHIQVYNETFEIKHKAYPIGEATKYIDYINAKIRTTTTEMPINENYIIPIPKIKRLYPRGFRVSIPNEYGVKIVAFHGKLNEKIQNFQIGDFNCVISTPINGEWIYENQEIEINQNDILNYWIHVQYGRRGYTFPAHSYQFESDINGPFSIEQTTNTTNIPIISIDHDEQNYETVTSNSIEDFCLDTITTVTDKQNKICKGQLIFEDTFDLYDNQKWEKEIQFSGLDGEFVLYDDRAENFYMQNGKLNIKPTLTIESEYEILGKSLNLGNRCTGNKQSCQRNSRIPPIISSKIRTKNSFSFRYGRIDIRAKLPQGDWIFPQIFLEPLHHKYGNDYASGQMRVAFIRGNDFLESKEGEQIDGHRLYGGAIIDSNENLQDIWLKSTEIYPEHFGTDFHIYSLLWTNDYIRMEVDGIPYDTKIKGNFIKSAHSSELKYSTKWKNGTIMAPFDQEFYISLGIGVGGNLNFPDGIENGPKHHHKPWLNLHPISDIKFWRERNEWKRTWSNNNTNLIVDYIRVYAL